MVALLVQFDIRASLEFLNEKNCLSNVSVKNG